MSLSDARRYPCAKDECKGEYKYIDDEYDSLGNGGSYEKWKCDECGRIKWVTLAD